MTVFTHPHKTGVPVDREVIIASGSSSTPVSVTSLSIVNQVIPAHSIGIDGYLVIDLFSTRTGSADLIILLVGLDGSSLLSKQLVVGATNTQTRLIVYADHSAVEIKMASQSFIPTPYYKGFFALKETKPVNIEIDNELSIGAVVFNPSDSVTIEGYCIRTFNPSVSKSIIRGNP